MIKIVKDDHVLMATQKAYDLIFKARGYSLADQVEDVEDKTAKVEDVQEVDYSALNMDELKDLLDERGIEYKARDNKDKLISLLEGE